MIYVRYLWYILRHKWWVLRYARGSGCSLWLALLHDISKLSPAEFGPYARWFYGPHGVRGDKRSDVKEAFNQAWSHHQKYNKHHWEYWLLGAMGTPVPMPERYVREMLADWQGAGRAITGKNDVCSWYLNNMHRIQLHARARLTVEKMLRI